MIVVLVLVDRHDRHPRGWYSLIAITPIALDNAAASHFLSMV
jgi:hypothetical protein